MLLFLRNDTGTDSSRLMGIRSVIPGFSTRLNDNGFK